jgi:hypothetical protein
MKVMDELKDIGPLLSGIKKDSPFSVPEGYFDHFQTRLKVAIHARESKLQVRYPYILRPYMAAAVLLIIALIAGTLVFRINHSSRDERRFSAELSRAVELELYSISAETILEMMTTDQGSRQIQNPNGSEDMINYLLDEDFNEEELLNSLKSTI